MPCESCNDRRERAKEVLVHAQEATRRFYESIKTKTADVADKAIERFAQVITPRQEIKKEDFDVDDVLYITDEEYDEWLAKKASMTDEEIYEYEVEYYEQRHNREEQ